MEQPHSDKEPLLSRAQRIGALVVCGLLLITVLLLLFLPRWLPVSSGESSLALSQAKADEMEAKLQAIERPTYQYKRDTVRIHLRAFDPNTADSVTLRELGLPHWMARSVLRYRAKGGKFRTPEAFRKVYGMNDTLFASLRPYIQIDTTRFARRDTIRWAKDTTRFRNDSTRRRFASHEKRDTILELNSADTASLQFIRGIGRYTAIQIVRYRKELGGYASVDQLREIKNLPTAADSILPYFTVCPDSIHPIRVNRASVEYLSRHPYLSFTQAKTIYELRRNEVRLTSIDQIKETGLFSEEDLSRLVPYLSFE